MPAAAVTAVGGIIVGKMASNANKHASDTSLKASDDAIEYQKESKAADLARQQANAAQWRKDYAAYLHKFYGFDLPDTGGAAGPEAGAYPGGRPVVTKPTPAPMMPTPAPVPAPTAGAPAVPGQAASLADMGGWSEKPFDWKQYGVGA